MPNEIVVFESNDNAIRLEVVFGQETVWLTQAQMASLFCVDRTVISRHVNNIFLEGELLRESNVQKMHIPNSDRPIQLFNLDVIISVGYRVKSQRGVEFRRWANGILKDYLLRGYCLNRQLQAMQERTDERFTKLEERVDRQQDQIDFFIRTNVPPVEGVFYEGQLLDARLFAEQLIQMGTSEIILVDNYIDARTFELLELRKPGVAAVIYVERIGKGLQSLQEAARTQTGRVIELRTTSQRVHDRFLIIDDEVYHIGASLNELGKRLFAFSRLQMPKETMLALLSCASALAREGSTSSPPSVRALQRERGAQAPR